MLENMALLSLLEQERDIINNGTGLERNVKRYEKLASKHDKAEEYYRHELAATKREQDRNDMRLQRVRKQIGSYLRNTIGIDRYAQ